MLVELPVKFSGAQPTTIRLTMEIASILAAGEVLREATSTHSREGDALAPRLKDRVARSFAVKQVSKPISISRRQWSKVRPQPPPAGTTPFP